MIKRALLVLLVLVAVLVGYVGFGAYRFMALADGEPIPANEHGKTVLVVVDVQRDLTEPGRPGVLNPEQSDPMIANINRLVEAMARAGNPVAYVRHSFEPGLLIGLITGGVLAQGSEGTQIDRRIEVINDNIFEKHVMDAFSNPAFDAFLREQHANHLLVTGMDAEACVDAITRSALGRNLRVTVVADAVTTATDGRRSKKLEDFKGAGAAVVTTDDWLTAL